MTDNLNNSFAPSWSAKTREEYKRAYLAGEPIQQPLLEHEDGTCQHCDLLRELQREADGRDSEILSDDEIKRRIADERPGDGYDSWRIEVDYWKVAAALCRALREIEHDHGEKIARSVLGQLTIKLDEVYPDLAWANVMTDSWPLRPESGE